MSILFEICSKWVVGDQQTSSVEVPDDSMGLGSIVQLLFVNDLKLANNSAVTETREKISKDLESLEP